MKKVYLAAHEGPVRRALLVTLPVFGVELVEKDGADIIMTCTREETLEALEQSQKPIFQLAVPRERVQHRRVSLFCVVDDYPAKFLTALAE